MSINYLKFNNNYQDSELSKYKMEPRLIQYMKIKKHYKSNNFLSGLEAKCLSFLLLIFSK